MNPDEKEISNLNDKTDQNPKDFGKVIDALHSKQKLSSLRTYQGDMAEFIKEKNESVVSVVLKEKKKEEENKKLEPVLKSAPEKEGLRVNLTILFVSLFLIVGAVAISFYVFKFLSKEPVSEVVMEEKIIPYNNLINLVNMTKMSLGQELVKLKNIQTDSVSVLKISDPNGNVIAKAPDFFNFLEILLPATLGRTLKDEYVIGVFAQNGQTASFVIISVNDFGRAFAGMLEWEKNMSESLSFLNPETISVAPPPANIGTTTVATTSDVAYIKIPMKQELFVWKDMIIKNKDARALVNEKGKSKMAYTFLDKNTILITDNVLVIGDIYSVYASRSVAR